MNKRLDLASLAAIQYVGYSGNTASCVRALVRLLHFGELISEVKLLTYASSGQDPIYRHCFLLSINYGELIAIKGGFTSGYHGTGPQGLSTALELFYSYGIEVSECFIDQCVFDRVNSSCLLLSDIERLSTEENISPVDKRKYVYYPENERSWPDLKLIKKKFPAEIPLKIIDDRIVDLAMQFKQNHDSALMSGYRRLEDIIRERTGLIHEHGEKLFSKAFIKDDSLLFWENLHPAENKGRATLFSATYMGYRNRRAHKETGGGINNDLREFLLLNQLYCLESTAVERKSVDCD